MDYQSFIPVFCACCYKVDDQCLMVHRSWLWWFTDRDSVLMAKGPSPDLCLTGASYKPTFVRGCFFFLVNSNNCHACPIFCLHKQKDSPWSPSNYLRISRYHGKMEFRFSGELSDLKCDCCTNCECNSSKNNIKVLPRYCPKITLRWLVGDINRGQALH